LSNSCASSDGRHRSDAPHIPSFPRALETVRRPAAHTERRKEARERRKERKEEELRVRREEVKRLKKLKMREMQERLERIGKEGGWANSEGKSCWQLVSNVLLFMTCCVLCSRICTETAYS